MRWGRKTNSFCPKNVKTASVALNLLLLKKASAIANPGLKKARVFFSADFSVNHCFNKFVILK